MTRIMPDGRKKFCYGLFIVTLVVSGLAGAVLAAKFDFFVPYFYGPGGTTERMTLWFAAAVGGNIGPLFIDLLRMLIKTIKQAVSI